MAEKGNKRLVVGADGLGVLIPFSHGLWRGELDPSSRSASSSIPLLLLLASSWLFDCVSDAVIAIGSGKVWGGGNGGGDA